jgi:hypothetical protein
MADPILLGRVKRRLEEAWNSTPKTEGSDVWGVLARAAVAVVERPFEIERRGAPASPFLVVHKPPRADGMRLITQSTTLAGAQDAAEYYLTQEGLGQVMIVEIKGSLEAR